MQLQLVLHLLNIKILKTRFISSLSLPAELSYLIKFETKIPPNDTTIDVSDHLPSQEIAVNSSGV